MLREDSEANSCQLNKYNLAYRKNSCCFPSQATILLSHCSIHKVSAEQPVKRFHVISTKAYKLGGAMEAPAEPCRRAPSNSKTSIKHLNIKKMSWISQAEP